MSEEEPGVEKGLLPEEGEILAEPNAENPAQPQTELQNEPQASPQGDSQQVDVKEPKEQEERKEVPETSGLTLESTGKQSFISHYFLLYLIHYVIIAIAYWIYSSVSPASGMPQLLVLIPGIIVIIILIVNLIPYQLYNKTPLNFIMWGVYTVCKIILAFYIMVYYPYTAKWLIYNLLFSFLVLFLLSIWKNISLLIQILVGVLVSAVILTLTLLTKPAEFDEIPSGENPAALTGYYADGAVLGALWVCLVVYSAYRQLDYGEYWVYSYMKVQYAADKNLILIVIILIAILVYVCIWILGKLCGFTCECLKFLRPYDVYDKSGKGYYHKYGNVYEDDAGREYTRVHNDCTII